MPWMMNFLFKQDLWRYQNCPFQLNWAELNGCIKDEHFQTSKLCAKISIFLTSYFHFLLNYLANLRACVEKYRHRQKFNLKILGFVSKKFVTYFGNLGIFKFFVPFAKFCTGKKIWKILQRLWGIVNFTPSISHRV